MKDRQILMLMKKTTLLIVTLVIGLIANVFTAVFVSRTIFDYELSGSRRLETLSI